MSIETLNFRETGYFSDLICDYIDAEESLRPFYHRFPEFSAFKAQIKEKAGTFSSAPREVLVAALEQQYAKVDASASTRKHIEILSSDRSFTITTGHQLNLFTGPLYFLYKILSVVNLCQALKKEFPEYNFVPVFWMASEDHDFEEISFFNFKGRKIRWNKEASGAVGKLDTAGLEEVYTVFAAELGNTANEQYIKSLFKQAYLEHDNLAEATRFLANELFGSHGLVIIDADDPELKRQFIPQMRKEVLEHSTFNNVNANNQQLQ
jgi:uncharacterized protein YllA (UPF0747 family)